MSSTCIMDIAEIFATELCGSRTKDLSETTAKQSLSAEQGDGDDIFAFFDTDDGEEDQGSACVGDVCSGGDGSDGGGGGGGSDGGEVDTHDVHVGADEFTGETRLTTELLAGGGFAVDGSGGGGGGGGGEHMGEHGQDQINGEADADIDRVGDDVTKDDADGDKIGDVVDIGKAVNDAVREATRDEERMDRGEESELISLIRGDTTSNNCSSRNDLKHFPNNTNNYQNNHSSARGSRNYEHNCLNTKYGSEVNNSLDGDDMGIAGGFRQTNPAINAKNGEGGSSMTFNKTNNSRSNSNTYKAHNTGLRRGSSSGRGSGAGPVKRARSRPGRDVRQDKPTLFACLTNTHSE